MYFIVLLEVSHGLSFFCLYAATKVDQVVSTPPCRWDQITIATGNTTLCWDCPICPTGMGLSPQCGSYVGSGVKIECVPCAAGVSYSDSHDVSSCRPCSICDNHEATIRTCTKERNAVCGKCKHGYYRSIAMDCWPCMKCCPNSTHNELEPDCLGQGLPAERSCRQDIRTEMCADSVPTPRDPSRNSSQSENATVLPSESPKLARVYGSLKSEKVLLWVLIGVLATLLVFVTVGAVFLVCTQYQCFSSTPVLLEKPPDFAVMEKGSTSQQPRPVLVMGRNQSNGFLVPPV